MIRQSFLTNYYVLLSCRVAGGPRSFNNERSTAVLRSDRGSLGHEYFKHIRSLGDLTFQRYPMRRPLKCVENSKFAIMCVKCVNFCKLAWPARVNRVHRFRMLQFFSCVESNSSSLVFNLLVAHTVRRQIGSFVWHIASRWFLSRHTNVTLFAIEQLDKPHHTWHRRTIVYNKCE